MGVFVDDILFDFDSSVLRSDYNGKLDELGDYLVKNPGTFLVVGGFADSVGDDEYNLWLSKRRALNIKTYLSGTHDIDGDRRAPMVWVEAGGEKAAPYEAHSRSHFSCARHPCEWSEP